jgi:hypothetical protein
MGSCGITIVFFSAFCATCFASLACFELQVSGQRNDTAPLPTEHFMCGQVRVDAIVFQHIQVAEVVACRE